MGSSRPAAPARRTLPGFVLLALSLLLLYSPWLFGYAAGSVETVSACLAGMLLLATAVASLLGLHRWSATSALTIGAWTLVAPMALGFLATEAAMSVHMAAGIAALVVAAASSEEASG